MGGLVARGEGTAAGKPKDVVDGPRLKPRLGRLGVGGGGLEAEGVAGVEGTGAVPLLNSAHRGHLRLVSTTAYSKRDASKLNIKIQRTHVAHLAAMPTSPRRIWFDGTVQLHWCTTFFDDLGVLPM